jgi:dihydrolipoamide dehydrogenase
MQGQHDGFVKILCRRRTRIIAGAIIVSSHASRAHPRPHRRRGRQLTVDELALTFTVYPSLSGSIAEAARRLHLAPD